MRRIGSVLSVLLWLAVMGGTSYANHVQGHILCANTGAPLAGVRVNVTGVNCNGAFSDFNGTDSSGFYRVDLGCPGTFTACVDMSSLPPGATLNSPQCSTFTLSESTVLDTNIDWTVNSSVCGTPPGIQGTVFCDANGNGTQDNGEQGIPGVTVTLCDGRTAVTDANGHYSFNNVTTVPCAVTVNTGTVQGSCNIAECATVVTVTTLPGVANFCFIPPPSQPPVGHGDTATIGFWQNKNGQALILSLNGGPASPMLGTWLASNFGCLFGNLNGQANTVVAAQFLTYFQVTGEKTYAQVMAGALAAYATDSTLAGGSMAAKYGFNVSSTGTGAKTYNIGSNGTALGLLNNTSYTVAQLLAAANANCSGGVITPGAFDALNNIFDGINQSGDIN